MKTTLSRNNTLTTFKAQVELKQADDSLQRIKNRIRVLQLRQQRYRRKINIKTHKVRLLTQSRIHTEKDSFEDGSSMSPGDCELRGSMDLKTSTRLFRRSYQRTSPENTEDHHSNKENTFRSTLKGGSPQPMVRLTVPGQHNQRTTQYTSQAAQHTKSSMCSSSSTNARNCRNIRQLSSLHKLARSSILQLKHSQAAEIKKQSEMLDEKIRMMKEYNRKKNQGNRNKVLQFEQNLRKKQEKLYEQHRRECFEKKKEVVDAAMSGKKMRENLIHALARQEQDLCSRLSRSRAEEDELTSTIYRLEKSVGSRHQERNKMNNLWKQSLNISRHN